MLLTTSLTPSALPAAAVPAPEPIFICYLYGLEANAQSRMISFLKQLGARQVGGVWQYTNPATGAAFTISLVENVAGLVAALNTENAHVIMTGHSNYGLGGVFASQAERTSRTISSIRYIDDTRIINYSSPWVSLKVQGMVESQKYPNWWPVFRDGSSGIMPQDFDDPRGLPPYNYYITYQLPGDSTRYLVEAVHNGAIQRFPTSGRPAWYSPEGAAPDPGQPEQRDCFIINTNTAFVSTGRWLQETNRMRKIYSTNAFYATAGKGSNQVRWTFSIPASGTYIVSAWWTSSPQNTKKAQYQVVHAQGIAKVTANQAANGGRWNTLGSYQFLAGDYSILLTDQAPSGRVVADAIRVTHVTDPAILDLIVDNGLCPRPHFKTRIVVFRRELEVDPSQFRYKRLLYDACTSGVYYLETFHRGVTFYTLDNASGFGSRPYLQAYLAGASDEQIWRMLQGVEPVYDYFDFSKRPDEQGGGQTVASPRALRPAAPAVETPAQPVTTEEGFAALKEAASIHDAQTLALTAKRLLGQGKRPAIAKALETMTGPVVRFTQGEVDNKTGEFLAAKAVFQAFPEESIWDLITLYAEGDPVTRRNVVRAIGGLDAGSAVGAFLTTALEDKTECEPENPEVEGTPMRVCDGAYNQFLLCYEVPNALRTLGPSHSLEVRDYHIRVLKSRLAKP